MAITAPTGLVDYLGRPIQVGQLTKELAAPALGSVRHWFYDSIAFGLTPERLAQILIGVDQNQDVVEYLTLAEEMEERDLHYASVLRTRKLAVSALTLRVESPDDKDQEATDFVNGILKRKQVKQLLAEQLDAIGKGYSVNEIMWDTSEKQWEPRAYEWRDPRHFQFDLVTGRELRLRDPANYALGIELAPYKFIQHRPHLKTGLPIRGGLARLACVAFMCKNFTLKDWMSFCEVFGMPLRLGKYGSSASPEQKAQLLAAVTGIGTDAAAIIPDSMVMEFVATNPGAGGDKLFMGLSDWLDSQVSKGVLGQTMTTDNGSSLSQAKVHNDVREDIRDDDANKLAATIERDLVKPLIDLNFGPRKAGEYPQVCLEEEETEDLKLLSESLTAFIDRGLPVEISTILDKFGLEVPKGVEPGALLQAKGPSAPTGGQHGDTTAGPQTPEPPPEPNVPPPPGKPPKPGQPSAKQLARVVMSAVRQALAGFNPDQPRQPDGKFGPGGGGEGPAITKPGQALGPQTTEEKQAAEKAFAPPELVLHGGKYQDLPTSVQGTVDDAFEQTIDTANDDEEANNLENLFNKIQANETLTTDEAATVQQVLSDYASAATNNDKHITANEALTAASHLAPTSPLAHVPAQETTGPAAPAGPPKPVIPDASQWQPPPDPDFGKGRARDFREELFTQLKNGGDIEETKNIQHLANALAKKHGTTPEKALQDLKWYRNDMRKSGLLPPKPGMIVKPQAPKAEKPLVKPGAPAASKPKPSLEQAHKDFAEVPVVEAQATPDDVAKWHQTMTSAEESAWSSWKGGGYTEIRKAQEDPKYLAARPELKKTIEHLEKAVEKAPPFQGPLFRGMRNLSAEQVKQLTQVGAVHEQPAFASWSPEPKVAHGFFHGSDKAYGVMFRLPWNSGVAKAVDLGMESEALIGKGVQFKVARVAKLVNNGAWNNKFVVDLEEI